MFRFNHQVDFTLKGGWVLHEKLPQTNIVGFRTIEYSVDDSRSLEAPSAQLEPIVEEQTAGPAIVESIEAVAVEEIAPSVSSEEA